MNYSEEGFLFQFSIFESFESEMESTKKDYCFHHPPQSLQVDHDYPMLHSLQEIMEDFPEAETEVYGKILFYLKDMEDDKITKQQLNKWIAFRLEKDNYEAHLCKTSWPASFGRPSGFHFTGDYEYVDVMLMDENDDEKQVRVIVDTDFRTQFELARPTPAYQELVNSLPMIFVGTEDKLEKLIYLISSAAKQSLRERGMHIPPWRKASYMHSKWLSTNCQKISFSEISHRPNTGNNRFC